jgi:hypothetical protein
MANDIALRPLLTGAKAAAEAAWPDAPASLGWPRIARSGAYSVVLLGPGDREFQGGNCTSSVSITLLLRAPLPSAAQDEVELIKADRINAAIAQVQTGPTFTAYGYLPIVSKFDPRESEDLDENFYQVSVTLTVQTQEVHH